MLGHQNLLSTPSPKSEQLHKSLTQSRYYNQCGCLAAAECWQNVGFVFVAGIDWWGLLSVLEGQRHEPLALAEPGGRRGLGFHLIPYRSHMTGGDKPLCQTGIIEFIFQHHMVLDCSWCDRSNVACSSVPFVMLFQFPTIIYLDLIQVYYLLLLWCQELI